MLEYYRRVLYNTHISRFVLALKIWNLNGGSVEYVIRYRVFLEK